VHPEPLPDPADAAAIVLERYLAAFGPASRRDVAAWAGVAQRDFAAAFERVETVSYRDENGIELLDLPGAPLPPADTPLPVRFLAHWDQALLAYADRDRIIPPEVLPLKLTLSGDPTVTVDGRVAASWAIERDGDAVRVTVTPHVEISAQAREEIRAEAERIARFGEPDAQTVDYRFQPK
jgi:winged helix DNA-binding protein